MQQLSHELYLLVTCLTAFSGAIRVDWNTNTGPIVPATPRTTVRPQPPFREPAPVWEDQSNDIPNPNPYVYVLPPPSRPRPATNNYLTYDRQPAAQTNYNNNNHGSIVSPGEVNSYLQQQQGNAVVPSLAVRYIPNVGNEYYAVVPSKEYYPGSYYNNNNNNNINSNVDKLQGKYNAKTKKYKAYEKVKYVPQTNYFPLFHFQLPQEQSYEQQFNQQLLLEMQQLPLSAKPLPFRVETALQQSQQQQKQQQEEQHRHYQHQQQQQVPTHTTGQQKIAYDKTASEKSQLLKSKYSDKSAGSSNNRILS